MSRYVGAVVSGSTRDVAFDSAGNLYAAGGVAVFDAGAAAKPRLSSSAPASGVWGVHDAWVSKWNAAGVLQWTRLIGGPNYDRAYAIEVNDTGVYVAGRAGDQFPTTPGVLQTSFAGDSTPNGAYGQQDGFIMKLDHDGDVQWATLFGEGGPSFIRDIALDAAGHVYAAATGVNASHPHVTTGAYDTTFPSSGSPVLTVVAKIALDGSDVVWGTYLGEDGDNLMNPSVRVDGSGNAYVAGHTSGGSYPTTPGAYQPDIAGDYDLALTSLSADGSSLRFSTFVGGTQFEGHETHSLAVGQGRVYLTGGTTSSDLVTTAGAVDRTFAGASESFVAAFDLDGNHIATTYVGGSAADNGEGIQIAPNGSVVLTGATQSADFDTTLTTWQGSDDEDGFLVVLSPDLDSLEFSARIGGSGEERLRAAELSASGRVAVGGVSWSSDYPIDGSSPAWVNDGSGTYWDQLDGVIGVYDIPQTLAATGGEICGNGTLEAGEACDDGNTTAGDCCAADCTFQSAGATCADDGDPCTDDTCDGAGTCEHVLLSGCDPVDPSGGAGGGGNPSGGVSGGEGGNPTGGGATNGGTAGGGGSSLGGMGGKSSDRDAGDAIDGIGEQGGSSDDGGCTCSVLGAERGHGSQGLAWIFVAVAGLVASRRHGRNSSRAIGGSRTPGFF